MKRSKWLITGLLLVIGAGFVSAAEIVATITAYNQVELSGSAAIGVEATFENTHHSKGNITAGNKATMTMSNIWEGAIVGIDFYVKSNSKSGAGSLRASLDGTTIYEIPESSYATWNDTGFSTDYLRFASPDCYWEVTPESQLVCEIEATENSLGWEKVVVWLAEYEQGPETFTVNFCWWDNEGKPCTTALIEPSAGQGISLPDCETSTLWADGEWHFVGWSKEEIKGKYTSQPPYHAAGDKYYPTNNETLYALYSFSPQTPNIMQTTDFQSGEYALVWNLLDASYMAQGEVTEHTLRTFACSLSTTEEERYRLETSYVPVGCRYQLAFRGDSLQIRHVSSGTYIGHSGTKLAARDSWWKWTEALNHSLLLAYDADETNTTARVLWRSLAENVVYGEVVKLQLTTDYEFLLLFDVSDVPTTAPSTKWTCTPFGAQAIETVTITPAARKILRNGVLYIEINQAEYDIFGRKY